MKEQLKFGDLFMFLRFLYKILLNTVTSDECMGTNMHTLWGYIYGWILVSLHIYIYIY